MSEGVFTIAAKRPIREEMTISRNTGLGTSNSATWFSLGAGTSITPESYDTMSIYIGAAGTGTFLIGEQPETMDPDPAMRYCIRTGENSLRRQNRRGLYLYRNYYKKGEHYERSC